MTFSFFRSDKPVYTTASLRPISPCQPTQAMARPVFSYPWNPHPTMEFAIFTLGRPGGGFPDFWFWTRTDRKLNINTLELKAVILALHHWVFTHSVLRGHQLMIAMENSTVVAYFNTQGGTHSHTLLHLEVDLFQATNSGHNHLGQTHSGLTKHDSEPPILAEPAHNKRVESPPRKSNPDLWDWGTPTMDMFATVHNMHLPQSMS